jgi:hypothetical protein
MADVLHFLFALGVLFLPLACAWWILQRSARRQRKRPMR